jgi:hypothetical protein
LEARDWGVWAGLLHPAVVYEIPQSRESIQGRDRYCLREDQILPHLAALAILRAGVGTLDRESQASISAPAQTGT